MEVENPFKNPILEKVLYDYNQFPNRVLTSERGGLKTYHAQKYILDGFFKNRTFFATLRESQVELETMLKEGFWDNNLISKEPYNKHSYRVIGSKILIDGIIAGVGIALKTYGNCRMSGVAVGEKYSKSVVADLEEAEHIVTNNIQNLRYVLFDEFEPINPQMSGEERRKAFRHISDTLFRLRDYKNNKLTVLFCGNLERGSSALLRELNFPEPTGEYKISKSYSRVTHRPLAVWAHIKQSEAWQQLRNNSYIGLLTEGQDDNMFAGGAPTKYTDYRKIDKPALDFKRSIVYNLKCGDSEFTYWWTRAGLWHITKRTKNKSFPTFAFNIKECRLGVRLIPTNYLQQLLRVWNAGQIQFDSSETFEKFIATLPARRGGIKDV